MHKGECGWTSTKPPLLQKLNKTKKKSQKIQHFLYVLKYKVTVLIFFLRIDKVSIKEKKKKLKLNTQKFLTQGLRKLEDTTKNLYLYANSIWYRYLDTSGNFFNGQNFWLGPP